MSCLLLGPGLGAANAGELQVGIGIDGSGTDWKSDGAASGALRLGYRWKDIAGIYFLGRLGYGLVDQRILEGLQAGAQVWGRIRAARPYVRLGLLHIHEEPWMAFKAEPAGAALGVGDGIRHRTGLEAGLGFDLPVLERNRFELIIGLEATTAWVTYSSGPNWYWGGGFRIGFNYLL